MLTHSNLLYQLNNLKHFLQPSPAESSLSLLPPWHIYERSCGYFIYSCGMKQVYTSIRRFREDLTKFPPQFFVCVPLVIDTLQTKVGTTDLHTSATGNETSRRGARGIAQTRVSFGVYTMQHSFVICYAFQSQRGKSYSQALEGQTVLSLFDLSVHLSVPVYGGISAFAPSSGPYHCLSCHLAFTQERCGFCCNILIHLT